MAPLVLELSALPISDTFDGELVAFGEDGSPDFALLCERMLMRPTGIVARMSCSTSSASTERI